MDHHNNMTSQKYLQKMDCAYPLNLDDCPRLKVAIPQKGDYHICYYEETDMGFLALFRIGITTKEEISAWKSQFQESSLATWRVARTHPKKQRNMQFRIDYRCQHKTRHLEDKYISKNTNCDASMVIRALRKSSIDDEPIVADTTKLQKKGNGPVDIAREAEHGKLLTIISLVFEHNHSISTASALRFRDVPKELEVKFYSLFMRGFSVKDALEYHTEAIKSVTPEADWKYALVDRAKVPDKSWCYKIFTKVRKLNPDMKKRKQLSLLKLNQQPSAVTPTQAEPLLTICDPQPQDTTVRMEQIQHLQPQILSPQDPQQQPSKSTDESAENFEFVVYDSTPTKPPIKHGGMITLAELSVSAACSNYSPLQRKMLDTYAVGDEEHSKDKLYLTLHRTKRGKVEKVRRSHHHHHHHHHRSIDELDGSTRSDAEITVSILYEGDRDGYLYNYNPPSTTTTVDDNKLNDDNENLKPMTQVDITVDNIPTTTATIIPVSGPCEKTTTASTSTDNIITVVPDDDPTVVVGEKPTDDVIMTIVPDHPPSQQQQEVKNDDDVIMTIVPDHPPSQQQQEVKNDDDVIMTIVDHPQEEEEVKETGELGELQMACC